MQIFPHTKNFVVIGKTKPSICIIECTHHTQCSGLFFACAKEQKIRHAKNCLVLTFKRPLWLHSIKKGTPLEGLKEVVYHYYVSHKEKQKRGGQLLLYKQKVLIWVKRLLLAWARNLYLETSCVSWHATHENVYIHPSKKKFLLPLLTLFLCYRSL